MTAGREVYFEHRIVAGTVKVSAICSVTGREVSVFGPVSAARADMERLALRKLEARIAADAAPVAAPSVPRRGGSFA